MDYPSYLSEKEREEYDKILKQFEPYKMEFQEKIINGLLDYVRHGKNIPVFDYMYFYDIIYKFCDKEIGHSILMFHNEKIKQITIECYEKIKDLESFEFLDFFITYTERLNFIIYIMSHIFMHISTYYLKVIPDEFIKPYPQDDISEFSMDIYKKEFFDKLNQNFLK